MLKLRSGETEAVIDLLLLVALSEGPIDQVMSDRLARALRDHEELAGVAWADVLERRRAVEADAPAFSAIRARILSKLESPRLRRFGLALAAEFLADGSAGRKILDELAALFGLARSEAEKLLDPWTSADPFASSYHRLSFEAPASFEAETFEQALWRVSSHEELGLLSFKLLAARLALGALGSDARIEAFGEVAELDGEPFRVDALLATPRKSYLARFLGPGEALTSNEHTLLPRLAARLEASASILVAHSDALSPADEELIRGIEKPKMLLLKVSL